MAYQVLSRKYRPQSFEEVVQQDHVTRTLRNAITSGRLAHAILFSGPRGTGKTTIARILAKCVNCETGPTPIPCNNCRSCREITSSHAADVFEIDGASNNKVENVRELRENAVYMPAHSPYKIYIIDEIHMLSDSAFNALLKILEEPPAHVLFFFATTEPNKIPITILSRCQRHDLRRVDINSIIGHLDKICKEEKVDISKEGLTIISREADGSVRDALSILDHVISTSPERRVAIEDILDILGGIDRQVLFDISQAVFQRNAVAVIEIIGRLYERGQPMMKCFIEILDHFRNLLLVKMGGSQLALSNVPEHEVNLMRQQTTDISVMYLNQIVDILFAEEKNVKLSSHPRIALEMAFIRMLQIQPALSFDELIEKIDKLQKGILKSFPLKGESAARDNHQAIMAEASAESQMPDQSVSQINETPVRNYSEPAESHDKSCQSNDIPEKKTEPLISKEESGDPAAMGKEETVENSWKQILEILSRDHPSLAACFAESKVVKSGDRQIHIEFRSIQFNLNYAQREDNRQTLKKLWCEKLGQNIDISLEPKQIAGPDPREKKKEKKQLQEEAMNHPLMAKALKLFNGKIVEIKIL